MKKRQEPAMLTVAEAAAEMRVSPSTIRRWTNAGLLPSVRVGRTIRIDRAQLHELTTRPGR